MADQEDYKEGHVPTRLEELHPRTRRWLADKREADLRLIDEMIEMQRTMRSLGRVSKWLFFAFVALIVTLGEIGQALNRMISFLTGGKVGGG